MVDSASNSFGNPMAPAWSDTEYSCAPMWSVGRSFDDEREDGFADAAPAAPMPRATVAAAAPENRVRRLTAKVSVISGPVAGWGGWLQIRYARRQTCC